MLHWQMASPLVIPPPVRTGSNQAMPLKVKDGQVVMNLFIISIGMM